MVFGHLDESGDNGNGIGSSSFVTVSLILVNNQETLDNLANIIIDVKKKLKKTKKGKKYLYKKNSEIKFYGFPDEKLLFETFELISKEKFYIITSIIDKKGKKISYVEKESIIFNLFIYLLIRFASENKNLRKGFSNIFSFDDNEKSFDLVSDLLDFGRRKNLRKIVADLGFFEKSEDRFYFLEKSKKSGLKILGEQGISIELPLNIVKISKNKYNSIKNNRDSLTLKLEHKSSNENKLLQITDLISGAIFQKYENHDSRFFDIIENKIKGINK